MRAGQRRSKSSTTDPGLEGPTALTESILAWSTYPPSLPACGKPSLFCQVLSPESRSIPQQGPSVAPLTPLKPQITCVPSPGLSGSVLRLQEGERAQGRDGLCTVSRRQTPQIHFSSIPSTIDERALGRPEPYLSCVHLRKGTSCAVWQEMNLGGM